jgi:hypothetical protein
MREFMKPQMFVSLLVAAASLMTGLSAMKISRQPAISKQTQESPNRTPAHELKPNHIFNEVIPLLLKKTSVPLRLPEYVPDTDDKETPLYGILEVGEPERYSIQLAWIKNCTGGNACHVGYIGGSKTPFPREHKPEVPVTLRGGIKGSFIDSDCGAHCDDASLDWVEGGYYYGISLKAGNKKTLIRMANSAIQAGAEQRRVGNPLTN